MAVQLRVAGVILSVESDGFCWSFEPGSVYSWFCVQETAPDVRVTVQTGSLPTLDWGKQVHTETHVGGYPVPGFDVRHSSGGEWILDVSAGGSIQQMQLFLRRVAVLNSDFSVGRVFLELSETRIPSYPFPLRSPLDRALFAHRLPYCDGLLLHAAAVVHQGRALVFAGQSGRGKSTLAKLWAASGEGLVLGEESIALRRVGSEIRAYGTPWPGESGLASPQGAPVAGLFFLRHGPHNTIRSMGPAEAMAEFLPRSYLAPYDPIGAARGLEFLHHLIATVPMAELAFRPDADVVELLASGRWADGLA